MRLEVPLDNNLVLEVSRRGLVGVYSLNGVFFDECGGFEQDLATMLNCLRLSGSLQVIAHEQKSSLETGFPLIERRLQAMALEGETFVVSTPVELGRASWGIDIRRTVVETAKPAESTSITLSREQVLTMTFDAFDEREKPSLPYEKGSWTYIYNRLMDGGATHVWHVCEYTRYLGPKRKHMLVAILAKYGLELNMTFSPEERARLVAITGDYK